MRPLLCVVALFILACSFVFADQVVLNNGDRITGTIVKADTKSLIVKTEFMGDVTVQWSAVQQITSTGPLHLELKDGKQLVGPVTTSDSDLAVGTAASGTVTTPKDSVVVIRNESEQAAYEKTLHPTLMMGWAGGINFGFALTRGNSQTKNLALALTAARKTSSDRIGLYANSIYSTNDAPGAVPGTTANAIRGGIRYDRDFAPRLFGFGSADFETDDLQNLDLRTVFGGGIGFHMIKSDATTLDLLGGINYTRENYSTFTRNFPAATLGEELMHKWRANTVLTQRWYFFPDLKNGGEYRTTFDVGTVTKLSKWLGWQNAIGDIYVTNPPAGKKHNDLLFTTGLNISFVH